MINCIECGASIELGNVCQSCMLKPGDPGIVEAPSGRAITVSFCCNGRNGENTGSFIFAEFQFEGLTIEVNSIDLADGCKLEFHDGTIEVGPSVVTEYSCTNHQRWQGNMAWDSVDMDELEARRLMRALLNECDFEIESCDSGHPLEDLT